ncbi:hypothetical protein LINPERPRIM_LOCUS31288 [Linum perenne]
MKRYGSLVVSALSDLPSVSQLFALNSGGRYETCQTIEIAEFLCEALLMFMSFIRACPCFVTYQLTSSHYISTGEFCLLHIVASGPILLTPTGDFTFPQALTGDYVISSQLHTSNLIGICSPFSFVLSLKFWSSRGRLELD